MIHVWLFCILCALIFVGTQLSDLVIEMRLIRTTIEGVRDFMRRGQ